MLFFSVSGVQLRCEKESYLESSTRQLVDIGRFEAIKQFIEIVDLKSHLRVKFFLYLVILYTSD